MAKAPTADQIMAPDKMKPLLVLSKKEPVQAAIGLTADGEGLMLLDKKAKPKRVLAMLRAAAGKAKISLNNASLRFGRAEVDLDYDPGMIRLFVNKETPGVMRVKLVEIAKRIPYQKVEINVDPSLEEEAEDDAAPATEEAPAPEASTAPPPPPPPAAPGLDLAALTHALAQLIPAIPKVAAGNAPLQQALAALAGAANAALKSGALADAEAAIHKLRDALATALHAQPTASHTSAPQPSAPPSSTPSEDLLALFRDAKEEVDAGLNKLQAALRETEDEDLIRIADLGLYGMTDGKGVGLMKALLELRAATPDRRAALTKAAAAAAGAYRDAVLAHVLIDQVDKNPFNVEVGIRAKLVPALDTIAKAA